MTNIFVTIFYNEMNTGVCVYEFVRCLLLLQGEVEVVSAGFDLVLGLQVVHAVGGDSVDRQNYISHTHFGFGCLAPIGQL